MGNLERATGRGVDLVLERQPERVGHCRIEILDPDKTLRRVFHVGEVPDRTRGFGAIATDRSRLLSGGAAHHPERTLEHYQCGAWRHVGSVSRMRLVGLLLTATLLLACGGEKAAPASKVIGVTLLTQSHDFFKDLEEGLQEEARKHGYRLIVQAAEFDPTIQARQIEDFIVKGVDAIIICPCDSDTVAANLKGAEHAGIPVFTADIAAKRAKIVSHVASDNYLGGKLAGEAMARLLGGKGKVLIIDHPTVSSVQDRTRGFEDALKAHPDIRIVDKPSADGQRAKAQQIMEDALTTHPDLTGVFGINDDSALGALRAVEAAQRKGIVIIGYDATPEARAAIRRGSALKADVIQYPRKIGSMTVATIARHFAGEKVDALSPVEVGIVDAESLAAAR